MYLKMTEARDAFVQNYFFDPVNWKKNRCRLYAALFTLCDVIHPVVKRVQVDAADRDSIGGYLQQPAEESLSWRLQVDDNYRVEFHAYSVPLWL